MFDLFRSRNKAVKYFLGALLMIVALSMVVTLIPGYGTGGGNSNDRTVAQIGKEELSVREVQAQIQKAQRGRQFPAEMMGIFVPQIVDQMITERALVYEAERLGFKVTDEDVALAVRQIAPQLFPNGQFVGKDVYAQVLAQQNLSIPEFEGELRRSLLVNRLRSLALEGIVVTPQEVEQEYRRRNEKIKVEYVSILPAKLRSQVNPSPEEVRAYFERNRASYRIPEKRSFNLIVADAGKLGAQIQIPDADLRRMYDANREQYRVPERVKVRHILLKTAGKSPEEANKLQARAEDLLKQIKSGGDFAELAKKNSEDTASAVNGGELGWIVKGQTVPNFEQTAFSLKPGETSGVIKTQYGFHIIQVEEKENGRVKPFEEVKSQLAEERKRQAVYDTMQRSMDQAREEVAKHPDQAAQIAQKLGLEFVSVDKAGPGATIPGIGTSKDLDDSLNGTQKNGVTPVVQVAADKLAVGVVTDVFPARPAELAEVENQVRDALINQKVADLARQRAGEAAQKAKSGADLKAIAGSMGLEDKTTQEFSRDGAAEGIGPASALAEGFGLPVGGVFGPVGLGEGFFVCKVVGKTPADMTQLAAQRDTLRQELKQRKAQQRNELFEDSLRAELTRQGKIKVHENVIKNLVAGYRG